MQRSTGTWSAAPQTKPTSRVSLPSRPEVTSRSILQLQRTIGNQAVQRLFASRRGAHVEAPQRQASTRDHSEGVTIQRFGLGDVLDIAQDVVGVGSKIAGPANLVDKMGFLGGGTSGLLGAASPALGWAAPALALTSGVSSLMKDDASTEETVLGGLKTAGGAASLLGKGLLAAGGGTSALGGGSLFGMSAGTALTGGGAGLGTAAGAGAALSSAGAVGLAGAAGYGLGTLLSEHTSVGEHAVDVMGGVDAWLTDPGERSWMLETTEALEEDWDQGNYGSALWSGAKLFGAGTLGALGGIGGGIVDAGEAIGGGIADAVDWLF